jgi:hypothetical protein
MDETNDLDALLSHSDEANVLVEEDEVGVVPASGVHTGSMWSGDRAIVGRGFRGRQGSSTTPIDVALRKVRSLFVGSHFVGSYFVGPYFVGSYFVGPHFVGSYLLDPIRLDVALRKVRSIFVGSHFVGSHYVGSYLLDPICWILLDWMSLCA